MPKDSTKSSKRSRPGTDKAERPSKNPRTKKDPKAPKRALSAYMFFSQDWRERIKNENPDAGFGEVGKLLGAKWKEMNEEQRKPYVDAAKKDKVRADEEKADYNNPDAEIPKKSSGDEDEDEE